MANKYRGEVSIRLDRTRTIKLDFNALADFKDITGTSIQSVFMRLSKIHEESPTPKERAIRIMDTFGENFLRVLLCVGLRHEDEDLTLRQAGNLIELAEGEGMFEKFNHVMTKLTEAYAAQLNLSDDVKKNGGGGPAPLNGQTANLTGSQP